MVQGAVRHSTLLVKEQYACASSSQTRVTGMQQGNPHCLRVWLTPEHAVRRTLVCPGMLAMRGPLSIAAVLTHYWYVCT